MKDIYEVLKRKQQLVREKQTEIQQLQKEVDALTTVLPLLRDEAESAPLPAAASAANQLSKPSLLMSGGSAGSSQARQEPTSHWP